MNIEKILQKYGLNEKQAHVYIACLELGSSSVQNISAKSGLPRSTTYEVLDSLKHKGLIFVFHKKKVKYFSANDPMRILELEKEKIDLFQKILPELNVRYAQAKDQPTVRFYQGKEHMKLILKEILSEADEILSFGSAEDLFGQLGDYFYEFVKQRKKKKIPAKVILKDSPKAFERKKLGPQELREVRMISEEYPYRGNTWIWNNKVAMLSFTKDFVAIVIESKELTNIQKAQFYHLWDLIK